MIADAYILAGGLSRRFGSPKALAQLHGKTFAERAAAIARQGLPHSRVTFVTAEEGQFHDHELPGRTISDIHRGYGAWSGIEAAVEDAATDHIFVLACDLPLVSVELVHLIAGGPASGRSFAAARQANGKIQPLCSFINVKKCRAAIDEFLSKQEKFPPLTRLFEREDAFVLDLCDYKHLPDAERLLANINTRDDLIAAERTEWMIDG